MIKIYYDEPPEKGEFVCLFQTKNGEFIRSAVYKYRPDGNLYRMVSTAQDSEGYWNAQWKIAPYGITYNVIAYLQMEEEE